MSKRAVTRHTLPRPEAPSYDHKSTKARQASTKTKSSG
jgi:hypothetical protein